MAEDNQFIFSGPLVQSNIFRLGLIRALFDVRFAQNKFSTELNSPILGYTFRLQQFFNILISSNFAHIPNLSFPMDVIYNGENRLSISFFVFEK